MEKLCMLIMKPPTPGKVRSACAAYRLPPDATAWMYPSTLPGTGYCAPKKSGRPRGHKHENALEHNVHVFASSPDLLTRGFSDTRVEHGVAIVGNREELFVENVTVQSSRVISC